MDATAPVLEPAARDDVAGNGVGPVLDTAALAFTVVVEVEVGLGNDNAGKGDR